MSKHFVKFAFPINDPEAYEIVDTSMNDRGILSLLEAFIHDSMGEGKDSGVAYDHEVYEIKMVIDLTFDNIAVTSNCGNLGLELGILMDIFRRLLDTVEAAEGDNGGF